MLQGESAVVEFEGKRHEVRLERNRAPNDLLVYLDDEPLDVTLEDETASSIRLGINGNTVELKRFKAATSIPAPTIEARPQVASSEGALVSPLYGKVVSVNVGVDELVEPGAPLLVLEAMKMESTIRSDGRYRVAEVLVKKGEGVTKGQVLMRFSPG